MMKLKQASTRVDTDLTGICRHGIAAPRRRFLTPDVQFVQEGRPSVNIDACNKRSANWNRD